MCEHGGDLPASLSDADRAGPHGDESGKLRASGTEIVSGDFLGGHEEYLDHAATRVNNPGHVFSCGFSQG
jgi:hypothetical protein